jgi:hypothetical protein
MKIDPSVNNFAQTHDKKTQKSDYILKVTQDEEGKTVIVAEKKGFLTWMKSHIFSRDSYSLQSILFNLANENNIEVGTGMTKDDLDNFYTVFRDKLQKYDKNRHILRSDYAFTDIDKKIRKLLKDMS